MTSFVTVPDHAAKYERLRDDLQRERIAMLEAALRPFATLADEIEATASEAACKAGNVVAPARWSDCRRARDVLRQST